MLRDFKTKRPVHQGDLIHFKSKTIVLDPPDEPNGETGWDVFIVFKFTAC